MEKQVYVKAFKGFYYLLLQTEEIQGHDSSQDTGQEDSGLIFGKNVSAEEDFCRGTNLLTSNFTENMVRNQTGNIAPERHLREEMSLSVMRRTRTPGLWSKQQGRSEVTSFQGKVDTSWEIQRIPWLSLSWLLKNGFPAKGWVGDNQTLQIFSDPDQCCFLKGAAPIVQGHPPGRKSAMGSWWNRGSNRSLKHVEHLVLEHEKILTQFQILGPSPKQKQLKFKWANSADHYAAVTQFLLIPEVGKMCQCQPRHIFVISAGLPAFPLKISFC